jgi:hypothetical protein
MVTGKLADFRAPIRERDLLPAGDVFCNGCSSHGFALQNVAGTIAPRTVWARHETYFQNGWIEMASMKM